MAKFVSGRVIKDALCDKLRDAAAAGHEVVRVEIGQARTALEMMHYPFPRGGRGGSLLRCPLLGHQVVERRNLGFEILEPVLLLADGRRV